MLGYLRPSHDSRSIQGAAVLWILIFLSCAMWSQPTQLASLRGTVRDAQGNAVADASVQLQRKDFTLNVTVHTDSRGAYVFEALNDGVYALRVVKSGYADAEVPSVFIAPKEAKHIDLTLGVSKVDSTSPSTPQFFDQPQFTVAGVTDTTNLGGHGSDTIVRTRDTIAKETVGLGKPPAKASAEAIAREKSLRESVERHPTDFDANHQLGQLLLDSGRASEAIAYFERAGVTKPSDYGNAYDLALAHAGSGDYERARDQARSLLAIHDQAELHHLLGDVEEKLGDSLEAVRQYQRATELDPSEAYLFDWGAELLLHHAPEPAQEVFTDGHRRFPRSTRLLIGVGAAWFARGSYDQAVRRICEASDLNPNDPVPYIFLGKMQGAETTPSAEVVEKLRRFVTLQPQNAEANYYYAVGLRKTRKISLDKGRRSQVEALLNHAVHLDPKYTSAHLQLGILHSDEGNYAGAIAEYQQAIQLDPQLEEAHYRLAQTYRQNGDIEKAKEEVRLYEQLARESNQKLDRERHEIKQFVYTLRDQELPPVP